MNAVAAACLFFGAVTSATAAVVDEDRLLNAIRQAEGWKGRDGAHGERGPYQITAAVWSMHMPRIDFAQARQEQPARLCARRQVAWLRTRLREAGCDDGVYNIALCWNAGLARTLAGRAPRASYDYALRTEACYSKSVNLAELAGRGLGLDDGPLAFRPDERVNGIVRAVFEPRGLPAEKPAGFDEALRSVRGEALPERGDLGEVVHASPSITALSRANPAAAQSGP